MNTPHRRWLTCLLWLLLATTASAFYDPHIGRWINRDPIGEPGGLNLYSLLDNDPADQIDHLGLKSCDREVVYGHGRGGSGQGGADKDYRKKKKQKANGGDPTRTCYAACGSNKTNGGANRSGFGVQKPPQNNWPPPGTPWPPDFNDGKRNPNAPDHGPGWPDIGDNDYLPEGDEDDRINDAVFMSGKDGCNRNCCKKVQITVVCEPLTPAELRAGRTLPAWCGKVLIFDCQRLDLVH